ncbi:hypothetical protein IJ114_01620 [Candidatus Saccharibacteria bacterium]|nr:hypothetical protein [Candidatus Saccharibacteria bacterium]
MTITARFKKKFYFVAAGYFRFFANFTLKRWHPRIIAITGSVGKTTMLHLVEAQLGKKAHYSHDANSAFGIAFDLVNTRGITGSKLRWLYLIFSVPIKSLFVKHSEKYYIVEIDGERPHETEFLASWLKPEVTLWVSLGRSHAVQYEQQIRDGVFESLDKAITHEFAMLPQYTKKDIYIDGDVPLMVKATEKIRGKGLTSAAVHEFYKKDLKAYAVSPEKTTFKLKSGTVFSFAQPMPRDIVIQLLMLESLMKYLKHPLKTDLSDMPLAPGRNSFFEGKKGTKIIDSSYNAHLISVQSILEMTAAMPEKDKWYIIGDMVEQGFIEGDEHAKLADLIAKAKPSKVILVGRRTKKYTAPRLEELGIKPETFPDVKKAYNFLEKNIQGGEVLIFKGSQYLEWIIQQILKNPEDADKLPRREKAAQKRREKRGLN